MRLPDFFIVGAPKSGTTALHHGLRAHPEIHLPERKDVPAPYFGTDLALRRWQLSEDDYQRALAPGKGERVLGETCVWYLYSRRAAAEIAALAPQAQVLMVLRNPIEMIPAQHEQFLYNGNETIRDLGDALDAEPARACGERVPRSAHFPEGLLYVRTGRYADQVRRYLDHFPEDQVGVYLYEDLRTNPERIFARIQERIGVTPRRRPLPTVNEAKHVRSAPLQRFLVTPPKPVENAYHFVIPDRFHGKLAAWGVRRNVATRPRPALDPAVRRELAAALKDDILELEHILGRDLSGWLVEPSSLAAETR
jgi:hypothetical protein